jgi:outer membrane autotransporter protein
VIGGFDRQVADSLLVGGSLGYSNTKANMKDLSDTATVSSYQGSLYGVYNADPWYMSGIMVFGYNRYDSSRDISFGGIARRATAVYGGQTLGTQLEGGVRLRSSRMDVIPVASLTGMRLMRDSFRERDAGALNLDVDGDRTSSLQSSLGMRIRKEFKVASGTVTPEIRGSWLHEFSNEDYLLSGSVVGYPASTFTVRGDKPYRDSVNTGFSLTWETTQGMDLYLSYDAILSGDHTGQGGSLGIRYMW